MRRLDEGLRLGHKLILISAPAGFGKSTLLSQWVRHRDGMTPPLQAGWISLDEGDNDSVRFWTYFITALQRINADIGEISLAALRSAQPAPVETLLTGLINEIVERPDQLVLILDDFHAITDRQIHDGLLFLLRNRPPHLHLILSGRSDPPWPLARLRARCEMTELRAGDLRFTPDEACAFLNEGMGLGLRAEDIAALEARTEGWVAGLQMAALSMRDKEDTSGFVASLSGSHRYIADYLADEALDQQSPDVQDFLLKTAILDRLTGPLCDAVTGRSGSQAILERLDENNLFLVSLDDDRCWYRYHRLFADLLHVRLDQAHPDQARGLHLRASEWFANQGDLDTSIAHAMAAPHPERALDLLNQHTETLWSRGEYATLLKWLNQLGHNVTRSRPRLRVHHALTLIMTGDFDTGVVRLQELERELGIDTRRIAEAPTQQGQPPSSQEQRSLGALVGMIALGQAYAAYYRRNAPDMVRFSRLALKNLPQENRIWRGGVAIILGNAHMHNGNIEAAIQAFSEALAAARAIDSEFLSLSASVHLAISCVYQGQLRRAVGICRQQLSSHRLSKMPAAGALHAVWGDALREWNRLEDARRRVHKGCDLCERGSGVAMLGWSYIALVKVMFAEQDFVGVDRVLQKLEALAQAPAWVSAGATAWKARAWLAQGRLEAASHLLRERGLTVNDEPSLLHLEAYIVLARLLIAQGIERSSRADVAVGRTSESASHLVSRASDDAVPLLLRLRREAETAGWAVKLIQILILLALAYYARGEVEEGLETLNQALILAEPEELVRVFLDEGEPVVDMLRRAAYRRDASGYINQLLSVANAESGAPVPPPDPLSERELEVLALIAEGLTNKEIGDRLFITTGTVKVHASHIYRKLGVSGRIQAVAWARELGLL